MKKYKRIIEVDKLPPEEQFKAYTKLTKKELIEIIIRMNQDISDLEDRIRKILPTI